MGTDVTYGIRLILPTALAVVDMVENPKTPPIPPALSHTRNPPDIPSLKTRQVAEGCRGKTTVRYLSPVRGDPNRLRL